jgi:hypothetical protein
MIHGTNDKRQNPKISGIGCKMKYRNNEQKIKRIVIFRHAEGTEEHTWPKKLLLFENVAAGDQTIAVTR